jgi:hypothetical protein
LRKRKRGKFGWLAQGETPQKGAGLAEKGIIPELSNVAV